MTRRGQLFQLIVLATSIFSAAAAEEDEWISLFNGKDLSGWKANADPGAFTVTDGILKAHATHPTNRGHLFFVGDDDELVRFKNFELIAVVRSEPNSATTINLIVNPQEPP